MTLTRRAQTMLAALFGALLAAIYAIAWAAPAIGLLYDDGAWLAAAAEPSQTSRAPLFPLLLGAFARVSGNPLWLKTLPLACLAAWLCVSFYVLNRLGASTFAALLLVLMSAASPAAILAGTSLLPYSLFALLVAAAFLAFLQDRAVGAGLLTGLAILTEPPALALAAAFIIVFLARQRFRSAVLFTAGAMAVAAPWWAWSFAHSMGSVLLPLRANEWLVVAGHNFLALFASPFEAMTGIYSIYAIVGTVGILIWALVRRRQLMPDLFLLLLALALTLRAALPEPLVAAVLPFFLWLLWRTFRTARIREGVTAAIVILTALSLGTDLSRMPATVRLGQFPSSGALPDDWHQMRVLFAYVRDTAPLEASILADLDTAFARNTGRRVIRGFTRDPYKVFYGPASPAVTPDQLASAIQANGVEYVAVTPDRNIPESADWHKAAEALEHAGMLEPVPVPGAARDYRLLRVVSYRFGR